MKPVQIVLLVIAGAMGGALVTRIWHRKPVAVTPPATVAAVAAARPKTVPVEMSVPAAAQPLAAVPPAQAPPAALQPPAAESRKPSPVAPPGPAPAKAKPPAAPANNRAGHRPAPSPLKFHKSPPPAHPRPLELGQAAPMRVPAPAAAPPPEPPAAREPQPQPLVIPPLHTDTPAEPGPAPAAMETAPPLRVTLNAGMVIPVRLVDGLSSDRNLAGDTFAATLDRELVADGWVIAERGAVVEGRVVAVGRGSRASGNAVIAVELTRIHTSDGQAVPVQTDSFERRSRADHQVDAEKIGGGAVIGAIIGAIAGGGKGAAIGAGAGGAAGAGDVVLTRKPATLPSEMRIPFRLRAPITVTEKRG